MASFTPGVYLELMAPKGDPWVHTAVPVFVGLLTLPANLAVTVPFGSSNQFSLLTLDYVGWARLENACGTSWGERFLAFAVRGFFENGGTRCFVASWSVEGLPGTPQPTPEALAELLDELKSFDGFDIICAPGLAQLQPNAEVQDSYHKELIRGATKLGCFAILDCVGYDDQLSIEDWVGTLRRTDDTAEPPSNAALYAPWLKVGGACPSCLGTGVGGERSCVPCGGTGHGHVPPCGHVAGIFAKVDREVGVHKAPANVPLQGVSGLQLKVTNALLGAVQEKRCNGIRAFSSRGIRIWGARTLTDEPVSVRRLLLTVARWLQLALQELEFEPNDTRLWLRVSRQVGSFLTGLYQAGMLQGSSAKEAFFVKCDAENNPPTNRSLGKVVVDVGIAPVVPNEFVVVRLVGGPGGPQQLAPVVL